MANTFDLILRSPVALATKLLLALRSATFKMLEEPDVAPCGLVKSCDCPNKKERACPLPIKAKDGVVTIAGDLRVEGDICGLCGKDL